MGSQSLWLNRYRERRNLSRCLTCPFEKMNGFSHPVLISLTLLPYLVWYKNDDKILFLGLIYPDKPGMVIRAQYWRIFS
jgi:hypothetical protein